MGNEQEIKESDYKSLPELVILISLPELGILI